MLKGFIKKQLAAFGRKWGYDTAYMEEIVDEAGVGAVMPLNALGKLTSLKNKVPAAAYAGATLTASKAADCGPCLQLGVRMAEAEGVDPKTIRAILQQDYASLSKEALLGVELALGTIARDGSGDDARAEILRRWGRIGLMALGYGIVAAQAYPTLKYAIGYGRACQRVTVGKETIALQHPEYA